MKKIIFLFVFCLCAYKSNAQTKEISHYVEFARTYGIVRYFSPNPYTQKWSEGDWMKVCALLINRSETQPLEEVFKPLAPTLSFSNVHILPKEDTINISTPSWYYYYSGSGKLNIPFLAKLLMPGLARYIPYYKKFTILPDRIIPIYANDYVNNYDKTLEAGLKIEE